MDADELLINTIFNRIAPILAPSLLGASPSPNTLVILSWPGIPISENFYDSIENGDLTPKSLEHFSHLVDSAISASPIYIDTSGISIEKTYRFILNGSSPNTPTASITSVFQMAKQDFDTTELASSTGLAVSFHPSYPEPIGWTNPNQNELWQTISFSIKQGGQPTPDPNSPAAKLWGPDVFSGLKSWRVLPPQVISPQAPFSDPHAISVENWKQLQHPSIFEQASPVIKNALKIEPEKKNFAVANGLASSFNIGNLGLLPQTPLPAPTNNQPKEASLKSDVECRFDVLRIKIDRPWLNTVLFQTPGWNLGDVPKGWISTGAPDQSNHGLMPVIPTSFLAIRNLELRATWSGEERTTITSTIGSNSGIGFGPFFVHGTGSLFDGASLLAPGIQVLAWAGSVVPLCPR